MSRYFEEYGCDCVSDYVSSRKDLLGYCPTHGKDRRHVHLVPKPKSKGTAKSVVDTLNTLRVLINKEPKL